MGKYSEALRKIEEERGKVSLFSTSNPQPNWRPYVLIFFVTAGILLVGIYGYGVYSGRQIKEKEVKAQIPLPVQADQSTQLLENVEKMMQLDYKTDQPSLKTDIKPVVPVQQVKTVALKEDFYTIQLIAYQDEKLAKAEAEKLSLEGYKILIFRGEKYFKVSIGKYADQAEAQTTLAKIKNQFGTKYHDAFIRFVKNKH